MPPFRTISILGTGAALPRRVLSSVEIDARLDKPSGWTEGQVGVAALIQRYEIVRSESMKA